MLTETVGVRLKSGDKELLQKICNARGEDLSDFLRRSVYKELASLNYLSEDQKKALGMST